jgi:hypothetical protein
MNRAIVVQEDLLPGIQANLDILVNDWKSEGVENVTILTHPKGVDLDPSVLRGKLQGVEDLEGAMLIGELPVARLKAADGTKYESDYYFMELSGNWQLGTKNVVTSQDNSLPSISLGRVHLAPDTAWRDPDKPAELDLYNRYLEKLHDFRIFSRATTITISNFLPFPPIVIGIPPVGRFDFQSLIVNNLDDPAARRAMFEHLYSGENISGYEFVTKDQYAGILAGGEYDALWILAHSDPGGQMLAGGTIWNACDYYDSNAKINFYLFEACSAGAITWEDLGDPANPGKLKPISDTFFSNILFSPDYGVAVIASSKPAAFGNVTQFFDLLHAGGTFGSAFKGWMSNQITAGWPQGYNSMILFGDPFISFGTYIDRRACIVRTSLAHTANEKRLRDLLYYRNHVLPKSFVGRMVIQAVYAASALMDNIVRKSGVLKLFVRCIVLPMAMLLPRLKSVARNKRHKADKTNKNPERKE